MTSPGGKVYSAYSIGPNTDPRGTPRRKSLVLDSINHNVLFAVMVVGLQPIQHFSFYSETSGELQAS